jgi:hypothetical protein
MKIKRLASSLLAAAFALACSTAFASVELRLTSGATVIDLTDGGTGFISYNGAVGAYNINVTTGLGSQVLPFPTLLDLNSVDVTSLGGDLLIELTQTGLDFGSSPFVINGSIGGTTSGAQLAYALYADASDAAFGTGSLIFSGSTSTSPFSDSGSALFSDPSGTFSLYQRVSLSSLSGGIASFDFDAQVPEPGSAALVGAALFALAAVVRRRRGTSIADPR